MHGFLGPNGSGKTTTLRTLLGLVRRNAGTMRILGEEVPHALPQVVEPGRRDRGEPAVLRQLLRPPHARSARDRGRHPATRVDEVLETVGLRDRAKDRVKTYSLGMKQRLAVASALLKSPELLILDEPANGLDPAASARCAT